MGTGKNEQISSGDPCKERTMQEQMELQLHEQYAINNNANLSSVVVLLAAMIGVFWGYGYMFIHPTNNFIDFENSCFLYCNCCENYSLDAFVFTAIASSIVIHIMRKICIYQGYAQRYEQFITFAIRCKHFTSLFIENSTDDKEYNKQSNENSGIFSKEYSPFGKSVKENSPKILKKLMNKLKKLMNKLKKLMNNLKELMNNPKELMNKLKKLINNKTKQKGNQSSDRIRPIQGLFGEFVKIFNYLQWFLFFGVIFKTVMNILKNSSNEISCIGIIEIVILIIIIIVLHIMYSDDLEKKSTKYKNLEKKYASINPTIN